MPLPQGEHSITMYACMAVEDNVHCLMELKCIVQGNEAKAYVDEFNLHSELFDA